MRGRLGWLGIDTFRDEVVANVLACVPAGSVRFNL